MRGAARPRRALRPPAVGARGARAARGLRLRDARRAASPTRLRARLLRAAAALAAARRRRGARARARDRPRAGAARARLALRRRASPAVVRPLLDDAARGIEVLVDMMAGYWERALAPWWDAGAGAARGRHPPPRGPPGRRRRARAVRRAARRRALARRHARGRARRPTPRSSSPGAGCSSCPSAFVLAAHRRDVRPAVAAERDLPAARRRRPVGAGRRRPGGARRPGRPRARADPHRARREASTTELARRLEASPAGVSEHLGVLRRAGLVRARREGRSVLYSRTAVGDALTAPASSPGSPS